MIQIDLGNQEYYDGNTNQFVYEEGGIVRFEYSLKVLYDWEAKWGKHFLKGDLTNEELFDFYMTMALDPVDEKFITDEVMTTLSEYIQGSHTATTFTSAQGESTGGSPTGKTYSAEEIYALMFSAKIDLDFENRNLNRLLVILRIISAHNSPPKKMNRTDILKQNSNLNAQRKKQYQTKG